VSHIVSTIPPETARNLLRLYVNATEFCKQRIHQIVINEIVQIQLGLDKEQATKRVFEKIKHQ